MVLPLEFASLFPSEPNTNEAVGFLLTGFGLVLSTLLALAVICTLIGALFRKFPVLAGEVSIEEKRRSEVPESVALEEETLVAISVAIDQAYGGAYRVKSVTRESKR